MNYYFLKNKVSGESDYLLGQLATKAETIRTPVDSLHEWVSINEVELKAKKLEAENEKLKAENEKPNKITVTWTPDQFERMFEKLTALLFKSKEVDATEFYFKTSDDSEEYEFGMKANKKEQGR